MIVPEGAYPHVHKHTDSLCTVKGGCACVEEAYTSLACHLTVTCLLFSFLSRLTLHTRSAVIDYLHTLTSSSLGTFGEDLHSMLTLVPY